MGHGMYMCDVAYEKKIFGPKPGDRLEPIMLLKLPIMLLSNAPFFPLLCPNYAPFLT